MPDILGLLDSISSPRLPRRIRGLLNLIFVGSITSFFFEIVYFEYSLIDFFAYEKLFRFFIEGNFILPFSIFYLSWWATDIIGSLIFKWPNTYLDKKLRPFALTVLKAKWKRAQDRSQTGLNTNADQRMKKRINSKSVKQELSEKLAVENEFVLLFRALLASFLYFNQIPYFGGVMFSVIIMMILSAALVSVIKYQAFQLFREFASVIEADADDSVDNQGSSVTGLNQFASNPTMRK